MSKAKSLQVWEVWLDAPELLPCCKVGLVSRDLSWSNASFAFSYDSEWLQSDALFMLDPRLGQYPGPQYPPEDAQAFGIFMDSAPDRWGRVLMERREFMEARKAGRAARTLWNMDFLLGVEDEVRMGALRFRDVSGQFVAREGLAAPPVTKLSELAAIARRIEEPGVEKLPEYEQWLAMLIAPGTSLGGARPKANFRDNDDSLWIAKFPAREDRYDVGAWEMVAHELAARCGIRVPAARLISVGYDYRVYCVKRFDRRHDGRRMYA